MDKNNVIGLILIFMCLMAYTFLNQKSPEEIAELKRLQDSTRMAEQATVELDLSLIHI